MALVCGCRSLLGPYKCAQAQWLRSQSTYGDFVAWVVWKFLILSIITQREQQANIGQGRRSAWHVTVLQSEEPMWNVSVHRLTNWLDLRIALV